MGAVEGRHSRTGISSCPAAKVAIVFPIGKKCMTMALTPEELGKIIKKERKAMGLTQADLALTSGTGMRFISDLENGKPTCQIGKTLTVLKTLGMRLTLSGPQHSGGG
jgi:y4mF family transcriptional regulator